MPRRSTQKKGHKKGGYRGSLGGSPMHGAFTTGASQELKQMGGVSRATQKFINKSLKKQRNAIAAANAAKKAANHAAAAAQKAANNAQRAINAANEMKRIENERKIQNRKMINDLVQKLGQKHRSVTPFLTNEQKAQNAHYQNMVNKLVGK